MSGFAASNAEQEAVKADAYAQSVLVPMGRPDTAQQMLKLAGELVPAESGLVIALVISLGDVEVANKVSHQVRDTVNIFRQESGQRVELVTETAVSISRGILDVARERQVDAIVLGVQRSTQGNVKLGTVVENVIATASCGVLIYRWSDSPAFDRVVVPVDGSLPSTVAVQLGMRFALRNGIPLRQLNVGANRPYKPEYEAAIKRHERHLPRQYDLPMGAVPRQNPAAEISHSLTEDDLLIVGFSQSTDLQRSLVNDLSNRLLNSAPGPVIMVSEVEWHRGWRGLIEQGIARLNPRLTLVEQNELIWSAKQSASSNLDYIVMIVLSAALATLGLLTNSAAVIIGAMLVAPLMSPLSSFSTGMATGVLSLTRRASLTLFVGVSLALLISIVMGFVLPIDVPTEEMLARGSPNLLDAAIALVSGWVAAYATARKGIPAALAGVAIAAALMPPICTIGLGIALRDVSLASGANLLFLANIAFIIAAQYITFLWMGLQPSEQREDSSLKRSRAWWFVLIVISFVLLLLFLRLGTQAVDEADIREQMQTGAFRGAQVVEYQVISAVPLEVQILVQSDHPILPEDVQAAQVLINELYQQEVDLTVVSRQVVAPPDPLATSARLALQAQLPQARIAEITVSRLDDTLIRATVQSSIAPLRWQIERARQQIQAEAGSAVHLEVLYQRVMLYRELAAADADEP